jgi:hypothetical protein
MRVAFDKQIGTLDPKLPFFVSFRSSPGNFVLVDGMATVVLWQHARRPPLCVSTTQRQYCWTSQESPEPGKRPMCVSTEFDPTDLCGPARYQ